ncbi:MAG: NADH-quinone oxidoreductase subunit C [Spirochaetales bacterium]|nr:NADH-quinone oxidoreductase subunit C [Spirochaetales bacterium]
MTETIDNLLERIGRNFQITGQEVKKAGLAALHCSQEQLHGVLIYLKEVEKFDTLTMIGCADWIEDDYFELSYMAYSFTTFFTVMVKIRVSRDGSSVPTVEGIWRQARTFEREIHEMFGVDFPGNTRLKEFFLENWQGMPPMKRDFDTVQFVKDHYKLREEGREGACNVSVERKKRIDAKKLELKKEGE